MRQRLGQFCRRRPVKVAGLFIVLIAVFGIGIAGCSDDGGAVAIVNDPDIDEDDLEPRPVEEQCESGQELCDSECIDPSVDPRHCGRCGESCPDGHLCENRRCVEHDGNCPATVCTGFTYCDGNTGLCRPGCSNDEQCLGGQICDTETNTCGCPEGQRLCGGVCFEYGDPNACGDCMACPAGGGTGTAQCIEGECQLECEDNERICNSICAECPEGATDTECDGSRCVAGACPVGQRACQGDCVDCPEGATSTDCESGQCIATACGDGQRICDGACADCPAGATDTGCESGQCIATACSDGQRLCDGTCADCPTGAPTTTCEANECVPVTCGDGAFECQEFVCCTWSVDSTSSPRASRLSPVSVYGATAHVLFQDHTQTSGLAAYGTRDSSGTWDYESFEIDGTSGFSRPIVISGTPYFFHFSTIAWASTRTGGTWQTAELGDMATSLSSFDAGLVADTPYGIYIDQQGPDVMIVWLTDGINAYSHETIDDSPDKPESSHHLNTVADDDGNIHFVILSGEFSDDNLELYYGTNESGQWELETLGYVPVNGPHADRGVSLDLDEQGEPVIARADSGSGSSDMLQIMERSGGSWTTTATIDEGDEIGGLSLRIDDGGARHLMYFEDGQGHYANQVLDEWNTRSIPDLTTGLFDYGMAIISLYILDGTPEALAIVNEEIYHLTPVAE